MPTFVKAVSLVFVLLGSASAANSQVCADPTKYSGTTKTGPPGEANAPSCDAAVTMFGLGDITIDATTCTATVPNPMEPGETIVRTMIFSMVGPDCCAGTATPCDQYLLNPCATPANFDKTATTTGGEKCSQMQGMAVAFTASATTCAEKVKMPDDGQEMSRAHITTMLAGCCTSGGSVCAPYTLNPCKVSTEFKDTVSVGGQNANGVQTCGSIFGMKPAFVADTVTCKEIFLVGQAMTNKEHLATFSAKCCGAGGDICANPSEPTTAVSFAHRSQLAQLLVIGAVTTLARVLV